MMTSLIVIVAAYLAGNAYIFTRGAQAFDTLPLTAKVIISIIYWVCALSFFGLMLARNLNVPTSIAHWMYTIGTSWLIFTFYMVCFLLVFDLLKTVRLNIDYRFHISLALTCMLLLYGFFHYRHPATHIIDIETGKQGDTPRQPIKIVAVSDVHLGYGTGKSQLAGYVRMINEHQPDLILIGGDLIDNSVAPLYAERMAEELSRLKAPMGIYMVPGNHEYFSGIQESADFIKQTPIRLLRDSVVTLPNGIQLIGRDDRNNPHRRPLQELMAQTDAAHPTILLDHQPYHLEETQAAGIDLQFSGHTHRGQVWPFSWVTDYLYQQSHGYRQWSNSHIYVSTGLSLWGPPFRIGTDSELVVFNFK